MKKMFFILLCCFFLAATAGATTYVDNIVSKVGYGDMNGMLVSIDFTNADDVTNASWQVINSPTSPNTSGVLGDGWSLTYTGTDTYSESTWWTLSSSYAISSLTINAIAGGAVFDIIYKDFGITNNGAPYGTTNSDRGWWTGNGEAGTSSSSPPTNGIGWEFTNDVALENASSAVGDLFGTLTLTFGDSFWLPPSSTNNAAVTYRFQLDTDHATVVPEPATMALMGLGFLGLAGVGSRMRKSKK